MKKIFLTQFERKIIFRRCRTTIAWLALIAGIIYLLSIHWILLIAYSLIIPILIYSFFQANWYYPKDDYLTKILFNSTKEERILISEKIDLLGKYLHLGEAVFLDDYMVLKKFGVILDYDKIKTISYHRCLAGRDSHIKDFYYLVVIETISSREYHFNVWNTDIPFVGENSMFNQILKYLATQRSITTKGQ